MPLHDRRFRFPQCDERALGTLPTASRAAAEPAADVAEVTGEQRLNLLGRALGDACSRQLRRVLVAAGHEPRAPKANAVRTEVDGQQYHSVVVQFAATDANVRAYLTWSDNPAFEDQVAGFVVVHRDPADTPTYWDIAFLPVEAGEVVVEGDQLENFLGLYDIAWAACSRWRAPTTQPSPAVRPARPRAAGSSPPRWCASRPRTDTPRRRSPWR